MSETVIFKCSDGEAIRTASGEILLLPTFDPAQTIEMRVRALATQLAVELESMTTQRNNALRGIKPAWLVEQLYNFPSGFLTDPEVRRSHARRLAEGVTPGHWVREHRPKPGCRVPLWHFFQGEMDTAACGEPLIPGSPFVCEKLPEVYPDISQICPECESKVPLGEKSPAGVGLCPCR